MIILLTIKIVNTCNGHRNLFGREYTFHFDISLTIDILKRYIISYLDLNTKNISIRAGTPSRTLPNHLTIKDNMMSKNYLDIMDNNENIFYLIFY